jgi:peptide/nickel transport system substrate-binding protein
MFRRGISALLPACLLAAAAGVAGCMGGGEEPAQGGTARIAYGAQPDSLDPARSFSLEGLALLWTVYTPPLTYRHVDGPDGAEVVPGLAVALPTVSADGLTYRFRFRRGLRYSDGSSLRASDFEHAVKRVLSMTSPGSRFFIGIAGARGFVERDRLEGDIAGIRADNRSGEVTIRLTARDGTFPNALATVFAAPVPASTPARDMTTAPPPGIGAFRISRSVPNREVVLVRTRELADLPNVPAAKLERIEIQIGRNARTQTQRIVRNDLDYMIDPVPADLLGQIRREHPDRYEENVSNSTFYFWLNSSIPPFDNHELRQAVHIAIDKPGLSRLYGGLMQPTCNFLPPRIPGHEPLDPCPYGDPDSNGDIEKARAIVEQERAEGTEVNVWGLSATPSEQVVEAFADRLDQIGLRPKLKILAPSVYPQVIGNESTSGLHAGFANWFQEFPHPASFMAAVRGDLIANTGNYNFSHTDIPALTRRIKQLQQDRDLAGTRDDWAALDRQVIRDAGIVPYGHLRYTTLMSDRMNFDDCSPFHPVYIADYSRLCLQAP